MNGRWSWRACDDERGGVDVDLATLRAWTAAVSARVWDHLDGLDAQPTCGDVSGRGLQQLLPAEPPAEPADVDAVLRLLFEELIPRSYNTAAPGYFGFIPAGGLVPAALALMCRTLCRTCPSACSPGLLPGGGSRHVAAPPHICRLSPRFGNEASPFHERESDLSTHSLPRH